MKKVLLSVVSCLFLISSVAYAAPHQKSAYIEGNVGSLYRDVSILGSHYSDFGGVGLNGNLGYLFNSNIGSEVGYTRYIFDGASLNSIDLAAKFILPFVVGTQDLSVFAKVGPSYVFVDGEGLWRPYFGIGGAAQVTPKLDFNVQLQGLHIDVVNVSLISMGLTYHFDI